MTTQQKSTSGLISHRPYNLFNFANFDLPGATPNGLLTGAAGAGTALVSKGIVKGHLGDVKTEVSQKLGRSTPINLRT